MSQQYAPVVHLSRIEMRYGEDVVTGVPNTPLVTFHGFDHKGLPLLVSMRRAHFVAIVKRLQSKAGMSTDAASRKIAIVVLREMAGQPAG